MNNNILVKLDNSALIRDISNKIKMYLDNDITLQISGVTPRSIIRAFDLIDIYERDRLMSIKSDTMSYIIKFKYNDKEFICNGNCIDGSFSINKVNGINDDHEYSNKISLGGNGI